MKIKTVVNKSANLFSVVSQAAPLSAAAVKKLIKSREIKVNGVRVNADMPVDVGDVIEAFIPEKFIGSMPEIIYEDENVLIVDKPAQIEVEPTLTKMFCVNRQYIRPLHRLDRNTVGLVVFALNERAYNELFSAFKNRTVEKRYRALVAGKIKSGVYTAYIYKDRDKLRSYVYPDEKPGCKKIITGVEVRSEGEISELEIELITGRTHQIRAHLAYLGCPVLGDGKYGNTELNEKYGFKYQKLCAYKLVFHKLSKEMSYLNEKIFFSKQKLLTNSHN